MRRATRAATALIATLLPAAAMAQDMRDFCPDRPGLGTPACTIDRDHVAVELGLVDWTLDKQPGSRTDTIVAGEVLVRYGVTDSLEAQVGWSSFGHVRERSGGIAESSSGTGDISIALRQNLRNPDGSGFAVAVMPFASPPPGGPAIGAGDWSAGLLLPISNALPAGFQLGFTGSIEAAVDADRDGHHLAYGSVVGLDIPVNDTVGVTLEFSARQDDDPSGRVTELLGGLSSAWSPGSSLQFDVGANAGLNRNTPDLQLYLGIARRF